MNVVEVVWHFPYALVIATVPIVLRMLSWLRRRRVLHYAQAHLSPWAVEESRQPAARSWSEWLLWLLLALAFAGPRLPADPEGESAASARRDDVNIMIVLDVSSAMSQPTGGLPAIDRARLELEDLLSRAQGERFGLIISAAANGLLLPPTTDYAQLREFLQSADADLLSAEAKPRAESADLAGALALAQAELRGKRAGILLLSRGASAGAKGDAANALFASAKKLNDNNITVATLDLVDADEGEDLRAFANIAGGVYARVSDGDGDWQSLYDNGLRQVRSDKPSTTATTVWRELFVWPLAAAALLLFFSYYRLPPRLTITAIAALFTTGANGASFEDAHQALRTHEFARAQLTYSQLEGYPARMGEGASAYRRKDYEHAANQFARALLEARTPAEQGAALFNIGNAQLLQGRFGAALEAYRDAQKAQPHDNRIAHNSALAQSRLALQRRNRSEGVPGRRGAQLGGGQGEDISQRPAGMEEDKRSDPWMMLDESDAARRAMRGDLGGRGSDAARPLQTEAAARIARKKVELLQDDQRRLLRGLLVFEAQRREPATQR